jgi:hypothetical protein
VLGSDPNYGSGLILVDEKGEVRAFLHQDPETGLGLSLRDEEGQRRAVLSYDPKLGPSLSLHNEKGEVRAALGCKAGPTLYLYDNLGLRAAFGCSPESSASSKSGPALFLYDEKSEMRAALGCYPEIGANLTFRDEKGEILYGPHSSRDPAEVENH